jgi:hypothetical protein
MPDRVDQDRVTDRSSSVQGGGGVYLKAIAPLDLEVVSG